MHFNRGSDRRIDDISVAQERRKFAADRRQQQLQFLSLFRNADEGEVVEAIGESEVLHLHAGEILLHPGETNETVFLVLSGTLAAYLDSSGKVDDAIAIEAGECLGELSAIDGKPVSALVKASVDSRVLALSQDIFWNRLMAVPGVARNLMVVLTTRMRRNNAIVLEGQRRQIELAYLRQELDVARQLQLGMLPIRKPMFPDRQDVEVAGMMEAASAVGGDLFDAFFVAPQRLFFCIGDVSGHGIPAAMFMARAVSLMRMAAFVQDDPAVLLARVNDQLCAGNGANMFITLFCGFLDTGTGRISYSNAGHLAPILVRRGDSQPLELPKGMVIGVMEGIRYRSLDAELQPDDVLLCFTDGVTEAQTATEEDYSEPRLARLVADQAECALDDLLQQIRADVARFTDTQELADDCTLLAVRRRVH
jgi:sigma-B regulation protein RsbU (phosphoserine phosphatase)